jgi:hypothetical protein
MEWIHKLKEEWREITGGSHVMHLEKMYGRDAEGNKRVKLNKRGLREIVKYATKAANFSDQPALVDTFLLAFKDVRRIQPFGSFIGTLSEDKKISGEELEGNQEPVGCACGKCVWGDGKVCGPEYHISQTVMPFPGEPRQLRLFDSGHDPPMVYPKDWTDDDTFTRREAEAANSSQFELPGISEQSEWLGFMSVLSSSNG